MDKTEQGGTASSQQAQETVGAKRPYEAPRLHCLSLGESAQGKLPGPSEGSTHSGIATTGAVS